MTKLSQNFELREFLVSETAARRGIDMTPPHAVVDALSALCVRVLEPLRAHYHRPVIVSSGYRPPKLNALVKGNPDSQHCKGEAADFRVASVSNIEVCRWMQARLNYDQLIYEFGEGGWVHVSWREPYRNEELTARRAGRRTVYLEGIVP